MRRYFLISLVGILATGVPAWATDQNVPSKFTTIRAALAAARAGDRVLVAPGTYREHGLAMPEGVVLAGTGADPAAVVIDGQGAGRILSCENFARSAEIRNLTFTGGHASGATVAESSGGALLCNHAAVSINDCVFRANTAASNGGAIWVFEASPALSNCVFEANVAGAGGGGVDCTLYASPSLQNCRFTGNLADWGAGLSCRDYSSPVVMTTLFAGNTTAGAHGYGGGAFSDLDSKPMFVGCTFSDNEARYGGAAANFADSGANFVRCTIVANRGLWRGAGLYTSSATPAISASIIAFHEGTGLFSGGLYGPEVLRSDLFGNTGGNWAGGAAPAGIGPNNVSRDPLFCVSAGPGVFTYNLQETSPCQPDSNNGLTVGAWPVGCGTPLPSALTLDTEWLDSRPRLIWRLPDGLGVVPTFRLTGARVAEPTITWEIPFTADGTGGYAADDPASTLHGEGPYQFSLYATFGGASWTLMAQTTFEFSQDVPGLSQVFAAPNPFNPSTTVSFRLGRAEHVRVCVYDLNGRLVARLADRQFPAGINGVAWAGTADDGHDLASGTYLILVDSPGRRVGSKVTLLK